MDDSDGESKNETDSEMERVLTESRETFAHDSAVRESRHTYADEIATKISIKVSAQHLFYCTDMWLQMLCRMQQTIGWLSRA